MEQFNLDTWLKNKSHKVVTKTGEEVKIIDTNAPDENNPIIGYIYHKQKWNGPWSWHIDGTYKAGGDDMDLFFANEEKELTEFEKKLKEVLYEHTTTNTSSEEKARQYAPELLDLAKEELKKKFVLLAKEDYQTVFDLGKAEVLKDLPKWEKCDDNLPYSHIGGLNNRYLIKNGYCIKIADLEILLKEDCIGESHTYVDQKSAMEYVFPKLKEDKDEKIRKKLLSSFKGIMENADEDELWNGLPYNDIISWLEKQKELAPKIIIPKFHIGEYIKPKPYNEKHLIKSINEKGYVLDFDFVIPFNDEDIWELVEQKTITWSEEDENYYQNCLKAMRTYNGKDTPVSKWIESLKERVQPQSEKTEKTIKSPLTTIENPSDNQIIDALIHELKEQDGILTAICGIKTKNIIAWLEKQGDKSDYNPYKATVESIAAMVEKYSISDSNLQDFYDNVRVKCKDAIEYDKTSIATKEKEKFNSKNN